MARSNMPDWLTPQLATLASSAPDTADWVHEIKYDGYRILAWVDGKSVRLMTRNRKDWTERFPTVVRALGQFGLQDAILDGELVVELADGRSSFQALQNALSAGSTAGALRFRVFDALYLDGHDVRQEPLTTRKARLQERLAAWASGGREGNLVVYSEHVAGHGRAFHEQACRHGLEGIISKRASAPYHGGRRRDWLKVKCVREQEFVIGGYTAPGGSRKGLGALHVGTFEGADFVYRGKVGTGFTEATLQQLVRLLRPLRRDAPPFVDPPRGAAVRDTTWVEPTLVAQVRYTEVTDDGRLRHPVYHGIREDKAAPEVAFEEEQAPMARNNATDRVAGVRISSPDKILYPGSGVTKLELAGYYEAVAEWMLPHIADRPLTMVRCPGGFEGNCFFQKHFERQSVPEGVSLLEIDGRSGSELYGALRSIEGLVSLVQLGTLEFHTWNCRADRVEAPDRFVMDIDPDPDLPWSATVDAALHLRELLQELGLSSAVRTTGGKGLHVVVPIVRRTTWDDVKAFSGGVASLLVGAAPKLYTTDMAKAKRKGRILLDYLRNGRGATAIASYSTRARAGAPVAMPLHWDELADDIRGDSFNVRNAPARMKELGVDPWQELSDVRQSITRAMMTAVKA